MATALDLITRAMRLAGIVAGGEVPSADMAQDGLLSMQAMIGEWETRGVRLGAVVDTTFTTATVIPVPVTHLNALILNLAVELAPEYGRPTADFAMRAERAFKFLQAQYTRAPIIGADPAVVSQRGILGNVGWGAVNYGADGAIHSDTGPLYP